MSRFQAFAILIALLAPTGAAAATAGVEDAKSIARLFSAAFDRAPDIRELNFWIESYEAGRSLETTADDFYNSVEFTSRYGSLSDQQYVELLYQNVLGRSGEQGGISFWTARLSSGTSRASVLAEFANAPENVARTDNLFADLRVARCQWLFGPDEPGGVNTGFLVGPAISGVAYESPTHRGVTGPHGEFQYEGCEAVRFLIGDTVLGEVIGKAQVTPFDLIGTPVITSLQISQERGPLEVTGGDLYPNEAFQWNHRNAEDYFYAAGPFNLLINTVVLLQSLDDDAEPGNGIVISPGVAELFKGVNLNLKQEWEFFLGYRPSLWGPGDFPTLRYLLQQANRRNLFAAPHGMIKPAVAFRHMYEILGLDARTYATCPGGWDSTGRDVDCQYDADGNLIWLQLNSQGTGVTVSYEYDGNGNMTREDFDGRGFWDSEYDVMGNVLRSVSSSVDEQGDTVIGRIESWQYDDSGNVVRYEDDSGPADGIADQFATWQYDASRRPTRWEVHYTARDDWEAASWEYRTNGKIKRYETSSRIQTNGYDSVEVWEYNRNGKLTKYSSDRLRPDGTLSTNVETREYGTLGGFTQRFYSGKNGTQHLRQTARYRFDINGNLRQYTRDLNGDGDPEKVERWRYDQNGNVVRYECNGTCDKFSHLVEAWQYNEDGRPTRVKQRDGAGKTLNTRTWQYDANGRRSRYEEDTNGDSTPESVRTWEYDARGNLTRHQNQTNSGDSEPLVMVWVIDSDGTLTEFKRSHDIYGAPSEAVSWNYQPTGWSHIFSGLPPHLWWLYY